MKRKLLHIFMLLLTVTLTVTLPSCRSAKKSKSEFRESSSMAHRGGRHENDKNGKAVSKTRKKIINEAYEWMGTPYGFGKSDKGKASDCSGLVVGAYERAAGIKLPRTSAKQKEYCKELKKKDVRVADLCFFATGKDPGKVSHVGIMVDDRNFIHASSSKGVIVSDITQPYWVRTFLGYGRVPDLND
ncbi:MAG: C40 family peptidase [Muribaculaceae bacterium]|nr:C40 family peptidase [Muribaculaceae bacterium]MDE6553727.1 C40 family peptidase [Muribaculaceae bacterium]